MIRLALRIQFRSAVLLALLTGEPEHRERVRALAMRLRECGEEVVRVAVKLEDFAVVSRERAA